MVLKMKECEIFSNLKVPCGSKIIIRADGRNFSGLSNLLKLERPYDETFSNLMIDVCSDFFIEFSPKLIFTFSDEINILLSEIPFNGRIEKLNSVFASFISGSFTKNLSKYVNYFNEADPSKLKPISFDSRVIPLSNQGVIEYFKSRQNEAWRNCLNGYSYWKLREEYSKSRAVEILNKKKSSELHEILFERGLNLAEMPAWQRRGIGLYKKTIPITGYNPMNSEKVVSNRLRVYTDWELPLLNEDFFKSNLIKLTNH
jgi:tRNA(His) guanylyltransferase